MLAQPELRLIATANRDGQVAPVLRCRMALLGEALGEVGADRFRCPAELIRQRKLLDPRQRQTRFMEFQREPIARRKTSRSSTRSIFARISLNLSWHLTPGS